MLFDNNNVDFDFSILNLAGLNTNSKEYTKDYKLSSGNKSLYNAKEGFLRGNMYKDEYKPYKNLTYINIKPASEREAKLFNVMQYMFALTDLNLYLDLHPDNTEMVRLFEEYVKEARLAKKEYMEKFGPLTVTKVKGDKFDWIDAPWSWDNLGGGMYV